MGQDPPRRWKTQADGWSSLFTVCSRYKRQLIQKKSDKMKLNSLVSDFSEAWRTTQCPPVTLRSQPIGCHPSVSCIAILSRPLYSSLVRRRIDSNGAIRDRKTSCPPRLNGLRSCIRASTLLDQSHAPSIWGALARRQHRACTLEHDADRIPARTCMTGCVETGMGGGKGMLCARPSQCRASSPAPALLAL